MKQFVLVYFRIFFICFLTFNSYGANAKPFKTALIFSGGGLQVPMFIGMLDGLLEQGIEPDVIIGTCGGSVAAAIVDSYPDSTERRNFIRSKLYQDFLLQFDFSRGQSRLEVLSVLNAIRGHAFFNSDKIPDLFSSFLVTVPFPSGLPRMEKPWKTQNSAPSVVVIAGRTDLGKPGAEPGKPWNGRKLLHETFFTDPETSHYLEGFQSAIAKEFPESSIALETEVISTYSKDYAVRASISDPYYFAPFKINDDYYVSGGMDIYPIEVAKHLADSVILTYDSPFDNSIMIPAHKNFVHYNNHERLKYVLNQEADTWIDRTDFYEMIDEIGMSPIQRYGKFESRIPKDQDTFVALTDAQYEWGRQRAIEGILNKTGDRRPKNDRTHIRGAL